MTNDKWPIATKSKSFSAGPRLAAPPRSSSNSSRSALSCRPSSSRVGRLLSLLSLLSHSSLSSRVLLLNTRRSRTLRSRCGGPPRWPR